MPTAPSLGRLERVTLREIWKSESSDFTPWLAGKENLALLGEAIGIELELEAQEKEVGPFRADILCKDTGTGAWVLIENQLERTDHGHLGQLLTYAAGLDAACLVWIAERFTAEHRAAFDWLNELASERLRCFGLEIELWRIGDSLAAPKFNVVCRPNDWARDISASAAQLAASANTSTKQLQLEFWTKFGDRVRERSRVLRPQKAQPQAWMNLALGRTGIHLAAIASSWNNATSAYEGELRAEVVIDHTELSKDWYAKLEGQRAEVEVELGEPLVWHSRPDARMCRLYFRRDADLEDRSSWEEHHDWLIERLERLHRVIGPRARDL